MTKLEDAQLTIAIRLISICHRGESHLTARWNPRSESQLTPFQSWIYGQFADGSNEDDNLSVQQSEKY